MAIYNFQISTDKTDWYEIQDWSTQSSTRTCGLCLVFNANGGSWSDGTSSNIYSYSYVGNSNAGYYGAKRVVPPKGDPSKSGYNFGGWLYGSTSSTTYYYDNSFCPYTSDVLQRKTVRYIYLYAAWSTTPTPTTKTIRINYDAGGGTFVSPYGSGSSSYVIGSVSAYTNTIAQGTRSSGYTMTDGLFLGGKYTWVLSRSGYVFKGWKCTANGRIMYSNSNVEYFPSSATSPYTIDVVAQWEIDANSWESAYEDKNHLITSGTVSYDTGTVYWKMLLVELGADYASNTSDVFFDFRSYAIDNSGNTLYDSRPYNYLWLQINKAGSDTGSSKYALNYTSGSTYYTDSTTGYNLMSQYNTANNSAYISIVAEASSICKDLFGTAGTTDGSKYKNVQWPHVISSSSSTNGLGCINGQIYYNRASGASKPAGFTINSTSSSLTLTKFDRTITYKLNGASGTAPSSQQKQFGTALTLATASWSGHTFRYWKCSSLSSLSTEDTMLLSSNELQALNETDTANGTTYAGGASFSDDTADGVLGPLYMYAYWTSTITLSLGTGASATATSISVNNGDVVTTTSTSPYQVLVNGTVKSTITFSSGYKFVSWSDSSYTVTDNKTITLTTGTTDPVTVYIQKGSGMYAGEFVEVSSKTDVDIYKTGQVKCYQLVETANTYNMYKSTYSYITMPAFIEYS